MTSQIVITDIDIIDYKLVDILYLYNQSINIFKKLNELNYNKLYTKFNKSFFISSKALEREGAPLQLLIKDSTIFPKL